MKKIFLGIIMILSVALLATGCGTSGKASNVTKLSIVQIVEHPALDAARQGFLEVLKANGYEEGKNLTVDYKNAQGDQPTLNLIAGKFASDKPNLILAIATPSAQAIAAATKDIPVLITAVTDPVAAKLVNSMEKPGTNITGTTDMNPIKDQLSLLQKLVPQAKKVGVIYNAGEVNSQVQVQIVKEVAAGLGLSIIEATVASSADVLQAAQSLVGRVDVVYIPGDNTVVSSIQAVLQVTDKNKIPVISAESSVVDSGGLATIGINYKNLGMQTGEMAVKILKGAKPQDMPIEAQKNFDTVINKTSVNLLGITVPDDIAKIAQYVETK
jgi:putative ABC transport system substrate-binding protein